MSFTEISHFSISLGFSYWNITALLGLNQYRVMTDGWTKLP